MFWDVLKKNLVLLSGHPARLRQAKTQSSKNESTCAVFKQNRVCQKLDVWVTHLERSLVNTSSQFHKIPQHVQSITKCSTNLDQSVREILLYGSRLGINDSRSRKSWKLWSLHYSNHPGKSWKIDAFIFYPILGILEIWAFLVSWYPGNTGNLSCSISWYPGNLFCGRAAMLL